MKQRKRIEILCLSIALLAIAGFAISCGVTIKSSVATGYDWAGTNKILVIGVSDLTQSEEISRTLTHELFENGLPVARVDARSVLDIYDIGRREGADVIAYGELSKVDIYYPNRGGRNFSNYYPIKTVEVKLRFVETETRRKIWTGSGSLEDRAQIADEFLVNKLLARMVEKVVPQLSTVQRTTAAMPMLKLGQGAPPFEAQDLRGNSYTLKSDLGDQVIVLTFWSLFCEQCKEEIRLLNDVQRQYDGRGVRVIAVSIEGEPLADRIRNYVDDKGLELTFLLDEHSDGRYEIADTYNVPGTPVLYVIGKSGKIVFARSGHVTVSELSSILESELEKG